MGTVIIQVVKTVFILTASLVATNVIADKLKERGEESKL